MFSHHVDVYFNINVNFNYLELVCLLDCICGLCFVFSFLLVVEYFPGLILIVNFFN